MTPRPHEFLDLAWRRGAVPPATRRCVWAMDRPRQLATARRGVRQYLAGCRCPASTDEVDSVVTVLDELATNALRHGAPPASVELCEHPEGWLVVARDADPGHAPVPAVDRPPELGGMGLHMVVALTRRHGIATGSRSKSVWALVPHG